MADKIEAHNPMAVLERRLGAMPIEEVNARRDELTKKLSVLRAQHGAFGLWEHQRRETLAKIKMVLRAQYQAAKARVTNDQLDDEAHASVEYASCVVQALRDRAELIRLEAELDGLEATVRRQNTLITYLSAEARLA